MPFHIMLDISDKIKVTGASWPLENPVNDGSLEHPWERGSIKLEVDPEWFEANLNHTWPHWNYTLTYNGRNIYDAGLWPAGEVPNWVIWNGFGRIKNKVPVGAVLTFTCHVRYEARSHHDTPYEDVAEGSVTTYIANLFKGNGAVEPVEDTDPPEPTSGVHPAPPDPEPEPTPEPELDAVAFIKEIKKACEEFLAQ